MRKIVLMMPPKALMGWGGGLFSSVHIQFSWKSLLLKVLRVWLKDYDFSR